MLATNDALFALWSMRTPNFLGTKRGTEISALYYTQSQAFIAKTISGGYNF